MNERHFISLGAGVQSSVMLLMADKGDIGPEPEAAIFADTQWEPRAVYEHLDWLEAEVSIPVHRVTGGDLRADALAGTDARGNRYKDGRAFVSIPLYSEKGGMGRRQCTMDYKIRPIEKVVRRLCGVGYRKRFPQDIQAVQWHGISTDEMSRMRESRAAWQRFRYPLVEAGLSRRDCLLWFGRHYPGRKLSKSACIGCPYHGRAEWLAVRGDPEAWADAVDFDRQIRGVGAQTNYVHRSRQPLEDVDLSNEDPNQYSLFEDGGGSMWEMECEGMCGV